MKGSTLKEVYQFKISLKDLKPRIWRGIQVPRHFTFWDLHVAIQDSMGWMDCHLHLFRILNPSTKKRENIGIPPDERFSELEIIPGWERVIAGYFSKENAAAEYEYDFGDSWLHDVVLEDIVPGETGKRYPQCVAGERACPPEDCGGVWGFTEFLEAVLDPTHPEHENMIAWRGGSFHAEAFDPNKVRFDNPKKRWKIAFSAK